MDLQILTLGSADKCTGQKHLFLLGIEMDIYLIETNFIQAFSNRLFYWFYGIKEFVNTNQTSLGSRKFHRLPNSEANTTAPRPPSRDSIRSSPCHTVNAL